MCSRLKCGQLAWQSCRVLSLSCANWSGVDCSGESTRWQKMTGEVSCPTHLTRWDHVENSYGPELLQMQPINMGFIMKMEPNYPGDSIVWPNVAHGKTTFLFTPQFLETANLTISSKIHRIQKKVIFNISNPFSHSFPTTHNLVLHMLKPEYFEKPVRMQ